MDVLCKNYSSVMASEDPYCNMGIILESTGHFMKTAELSCSLYRKFGLCQGNITRMDSTKK